MLLLTTAADAKCGQRGVSRSGLSFKRRETRARASAFIFCNGGFCLALSSGNKPGISSAAFRYDGLRPDQMNRVIDF